MGNVNRKATGNEMADATQVIREAFPEYEVVWGSHGDYGGGRAPRDHKLAPVPTYIQDQFTGQFSIYLAGDIRPATRAECIGLECCAVWAPEHVEDRLRDHFAGRRCKWGESLAVAPDAEPGSNADAVSMERT